jgi:hypothetical protein
LLSPPAHNANSRLPIGLPDRTQKTAAKFFTTNHRAMHALTVSTVACAQKHTNLSRSRDEPAGRRCRFCRSMFLFRKIRQPTIRARLAPSTVISAPRRRQTSLRNDSGMQPLENFLYRCSQFDIQFAIYGRACFQSK